MNALNNRAHTQTHTHTRARTCAHIACSEVVLLDFHRFPSLDHGPPHEHAAKVVLDVLRDVMIEPKHRNMPLGRLLKQQTGRVAVLWNAREVCMYICVCM